MTVVPEHVPPEQASLKEHGFPSSHPTNVRHCQMPPVLVQRYVVPPQVDVEAEHEQLLHTSPVPLQYRVQVAG